MSEKRPTVSAVLVAAMIESTPDRVRRRLDRTPDAAASWDWRYAESAWSVDAGGETVVLPKDHVTALEQLTCSCLLSPRCFHVLACLTHLEVVAVESTSGEQLEPNTRESSTDTTNEVVEINENQQVAACELMTSLAKLIRIGVANTGVVVQSSLLRAVHQCRAEGLHRLAALGLRVLAGTAEIRTRTAVADPAQLAQDTADALETARHILGRDDVESFWIGTARRKQLSVRPRRLFGLFAEPILTRSGFVGAAVYFLGEDDSIYTASDVRPAEGQHARDAYLGGIEIGSMIQPAKQLARGQYLGTDLTASMDGRLGRGKSIKIVEQGQSTWQVPTIQERFRRPMVEQWNAIYTRAQLPNDARPAGWDFVFLQGTVLGAVGPELLFQLTEDSQPVRLAIENESPALYFRENLRMLGHAPGLRLQIIARVNLEEPRIVAPLAAAGFEATLGKENEPRLDLPAQLGGRVCLGFDEIQRHFLLNARAAVVNLNVQVTQPDQENPLGCLRRRWIAVLLSGSVSQRLSNANLIASETAILNRSGFTTGAALLDALASAAGKNGSTDVDTFLATSLYLRVCSYELARSRATLSLF